MEAYCFEQGYSLILCNTENQPPRQQHYLRMLMEKRVDGLLVLGTDIDTQFRDMLRIHKRCRRWCWTGATSAISPT